MKHVFSVGPMFSIPDGTKVSPFLNFLNANQHELKQRGDEGVSLAVGEIPSGVISKIHVHPIVTQITWVISGRLHVRMKETKALEPYTLLVEHGNAVLTEPGTFFQLINPSLETIRALYIASSVMCSFWIRTPVPLATTMQSFLRKLGTPCNNLN